MLSGFALSMKVNTSSPEPIVTLVMTGELTAAKTMVYGFLPPCMVRPHGSHVVRTSVKFGCTDATKLGGVYKHVVSLPSGPHVSARSNADRRHGQHSPVTLYSCGGIPPVLPFESIMDSIRLEPATDCGENGALRVAGREWFTSLVSDLP